MRTEVSTKTISETEKESGVFLISCFSDMNADGTTTPSIFKAQVLSVPKIIDNTNGKEGELMLSFEGNDAGELNDDGELVIEPNDDDANKYSKVDENLIYTTD